MESIQSPQIKNIIFDLGGVILNIDYHKTEAAFVNLGITNVNELFSQFHANSFFKDFEMGKISPESFVEQLQVHVPQRSGEDIIAAWNAMLLDFPAGRIDFLLQIKARYRSFLLSNTNAVHHQAFQGIVLDNTARLDDCFETAYYSHELGVRKPDKEIFEFVLKENGLKPSETLFLDDTPANIEAAQAIGINSILLKPGDKIEDLLKTF